MCIHPRCYSRPIITIMNTKYGKSADLCIMHARYYVEDTKPQDIQVHEWVKDKVRVK